MRRISILAIITLVLMAIELCVSLVNYWTYTDNTYMVEHAMIQLEKPDDLVYRKTVELRVHPQDGNKMLDETYNTLSKSNVPYIGSRIVVGGWQPIWFNIIVGVIGLVFIPFIIWGVVAFFRFLISVLKMQIFTRKNARRLRIFVYGVYGAIAFFQLLEWYSYHVISKQVVLPDMVIANYEGIIGWSDIFLMVLIVEIFAKGVKLQEEQELTI